MSAPDLLDGLDDEQRQAAEALLGPVCVLAGAGTGKTRTITHRIAHGVATGVYTPERVMALTFTARSAGELRTRLRALGAGGVAARTFHAAALAQLSYFWPQLVGGPLPRVLGAKGPVLGQAAEKLRIRLDTPALRDVAAEIEWRKVSRMTMAAYERAAHSRELPVSVSTMMALQQSYEELKDERRQIDFEDVLLATAGMIESEPAVAEQVRSQYRFFVVDEYQDVSPLQHDLLQLWLGPRTELCVVGDASQTIYSFAGASSEYLLGFGARYDDSVVVRLERNYRSAPPILDTANRLMRGRPGALELIPAAVDREAAAAVGAPPAVPAVTEFETDAAEAEAVAAAISAQIDAGLRPESIAVLYRVNAQAAALDAALAARGISTRALGATRFFDHAAVKQAMLLLKSVATTKRDEPLFQSVSDVLHSMGWTLEAPAGGAAQRERWELLTALVELADAAPAGTTLQRFAGDLFERQAAQHEPTVAAVTLATLHSAKGLEWDAVHLVGLSEGLLPVSHAKGFDAIDEERRLLYVGVTRARRILSLSWSAQGLRGQRRTASRFLSELRSGSPREGSTASG